MVLMGDIILFRFGIPRFENKNLSPYATFWLDVKLFRE